MLLALLLRLLNYLGLLSAKLFDYAPHLTITYLDSLASSLLIAGSLSSMKFS